MRKAGPLVTLVSLNCYSARGPGVYLAARAGRGIPHVSRAYSGFSVTRLTKPQKPWYDADIRGESRFQSHRQTHHRVTSHRRRTRPELGGRSPEEHSNDEEAWVLPTDGILGVIDEKGLPQSQASWSTQLSQPPSRVVANTR
jgi:hypothetical protein